MDELLAFSRQVFGANSYQADPRYYNWLYKLNPFAGRQDCCAAFDGSELVGVIHKMRLPLGGEDSREGMVVSLGPSAGDVGCRACAHQTDRGRDLVRGELCPRAAAQWTLRATAE